MKKYIFTLLLFSATFAIAQTSQTININNSALAISFETNLINSRIRTKDGDSKYYTLANYTDGTTYKTGPGSGFSMGPNFEFNLGKNSRALFFLIGLHYIKHGGPVFVSQSKTSSIWSLYDVKKSDPQAEFKIHSLRFPISLNYYFLRFGKMKQQSIGIQFGCHMDYLLNAKLDGQNANDVIRKLYMTYFYGGLKYRAGSFYGHLDCTFIDAHNLFTKNYAVYSDMGSEQYKESFTTIGIGYYIKN